MSTRLPHLIYIDKASLPFSGLCEWIENGTQGNSVRKVP